MSKNNRLSEYCKALLGPDEVFQGAFTGEKGLSRAWEGLGWVPGFSDATDLLLLSTNRARIVMYTNKHICVYSANRFSPMKPKALLSTVPPDTRVEHGKGRRSKITVGNERIRIDHAIYPFLDNANARTVLDEPASD